MKINLKNLKRLLPSGWKDKPDWVCLKTYLHIAGFCKKTNCNEYFVTTKSLAKKLRYSERNIQVKLKKLVDSKLILKNRCFVNGKHCYKIELLENPEILNI